MLLRSCTFCRYVYCIFTCSIDQSMYSSMQNSNMFHQFFRDIIYLCIFQPTLPRLPYSSHPMIEFSKVSITTELIVYYSLLLLLLLLLFFIGPMIFLPIWIFLEHGHRNSICICIWICILAHLTLCKTANLCCCKVETVVGRCVVVLSQRLIQGHILFLIQVQ